MRVVHEPVEGVCVLRRAVELGANLTDTADIYGAGASEELIAKALHPYPPDLVITTKGGLGWGLQERIRDARPEHLRRAVEASLRRLRLERIDLYQLHRHDPEVPLEESVGALAQLRSEAKIRLVGLSNVSLRQLRAAQAVTEIASVQNEFNRGLLTSEDVLAALRGSRDRLHLRAVGATRRGPRLFGRGAPLVARPVGRDRQPLSSAASTPDLRAWLNREGTSRSCSRVSARDSGLPLRHRKSLFAALSRSPLTDSNRRPPLR